MHTRTAGTPTTPRNRHPRGALRDLLQALRGLKLKVAALTVASVLWSYADEFGRCWPSQLTLVNFSGCCERTVRNALNALERAGAIVRDVPKLRDRKQHRTTFYRFVVGNWHTAASPGSAAAASSEAGAAVEAPSDDGPSVEIVGWALVDPCDEAPPSPANSSPPSPAKAADRRSQREKIPPTPTRPLPVRALPPLTGLPEGLQRTIGRMQDLFAARAAAG